MRRRRPQARVRRDDGRVSLYDRLREKIRERLLPYIDEKTRGGRKLTLLPIVGNGLTRIAAGLSQKEDLSWERLIDRALAAAGESQHSLLSLRRKGLSYPEVLSYALRKARESHGRTKEKDIWRIIFANTHRLEPCGLHHALVRMADMIATTNYDDLIEVAAWRARRHRRVNVISVPSWPQGDTNRQGLRIYKLHGTLPFPGPRGGHPGWAEFDKWTPADVIATRESYMKSTWSTPDEFMRRLGDLKKPFTDSSTLILYLGTGLSADEHVLFRMRHLLPPKAEVILVVAAPNDPPFRAESLGILPLVVPLGLAGSPTRRALAHAALLEILLECDAVSVPQREAAQRALLVLRRRSDASGLTGQRLDGVTPIVCSVGQSATARVIALEEPPTQESFQRPVAASWVPRSTGKAGQTSRLLIADQVHGQADAPVLVWDAIGLPSTLVSEVGNDQPGDRIIDRLAKTKWVEFDGVRQLLPTTRSETAPELATEHHTTTTWFGNRTGFDTHRYHRRRSRQSLNPPAAPIMYLTPTLFDDAWRSLKSARARPLLVFETGSAGDMRCEEWVASRHGIILSSPVASRRWFAAGGRRGHQARAAADKWKDNFKPPKDERGRYALYHEWLEVLREHPAVPPFLAKKGALHAARAVVVTLGELGAIGWERRGSEWQKPFWSVPGSFLEDGQSLPYSEIRDGLGCGDCARAGFVAALAAAIEFKPVSPRKDLPQGCIPTATAWLSWFGLQKIRHFGLEAFLAFLKSEQKALQRLLNKRWIRRVPGRLRLRSGQANAWDTLYLEHVWQDDMLHPHLRQFARFAHDVRYRDASALRDLNERMRQWRRARRFESPDHRRRLNH